MEVVFGVTGGGADQSVFIETTRGAFNFKLRSEENLADATADKNGDRGIVAIKSQRRKTADFFYGLAANGKVTAHNRAGFQFKYFF